MNALKVLILTMIALFLFGAGGPVSYSYNDEESGQKKFGVIHNIAEDRIVERVGGIYEPEGLDKYLKRKFDDLQVKIDTLESKIDGLTKKSDTIMDELQMLKKQSA